MPSANLRAVPLTDLDGQTGDVVRLVHEKREPVALTSQGNRLAVVLSPEAFDRMAEAADRVRLQAAVDEAVRSLAAGEVVTNEEMMAELDRWAAGAERD